MSENTEKKVQLSFRVDEALKNRFNGKVKGAGLDAQEVLTELVLTYLELEAIAKHAQQDAQPTLIASPPTDPKTAAYHEKLSKILASGDHAVIDAVTQNIDVFYDRLRKPASVQAQATRKRG